MDFHPVIIPLELGDLLFVKEHRRQIGTNSSPGRIGVEITFDLFSPLRIEDLKLRTKNWNTRLRMFGNSGK